jgi:ABC-type dipeptide/oligopeptide/nickel transport system permease subunit
MGRPGRGGARGGRGAQAILLEASLSFLGLGAQLPEPSWGTMLNDVRQFLRDAPWYGVFPGLAR